MIQYADMLVHTRVLATITVLFLLRLEICKIVWTEQNHSTQENQFLTEGLRTHKLPST